MPKAAAVARVDDGALAKPIGDGPGSLPVLVEAADPGREGLPAASADDDPVAVASRAATASEALDALLPAMAQGNARAMLAHRSLIGRCAEYRDGERFWPQPTAPEGSAQWFAQRDAVAQEGRFCGADPRLHDPLLRGARSTTQRLNALTRTGDPEALAFALGTGALQLQSTSEAKLALDLLAGQELSPDGKASLIDKLITGRIAPEHSRLGADLFDRMLIQPERQRLLKQLAAEVYGCQIGADCRAYGAFQNQYCITFGNCAPSLTWDQFILTRQVAPHEADIIVALVDRLRQFPPRG